MIGLLRMATPFCVWILFASGVAKAGVPDPASSECNSPGALSLGIACTGKTNVYVVGGAAGIPDPVGAFCVTVRDFNNVPIENASVVIDFSDCGLQLCTDQLDPEAITDCPSQTVRKLTDPGGVACFKVQGKSRSGLGCGGPAKDCVRIFADGVLLHTTDSPTFDLVSQGGEDGLNQNDLSELLRQWLLCRSNAPRANYDCTNQLLNPNDLAAFLAVRLRGGSATNCAGAKDPYLGPKCP